MTAQRSHNPSLTPDQHAALEAAKLALSAAEAELRHSLQQVKTAPRADKITINDSLQAAFDNLAKVKAALATLERLASERD